MWLSIEMMFIGVDYEDGASTNSSDKYPTSGSFVSRLAPLWTAASTAGRSPFFTASIRSWNYYIIDNISTESEIYLLSEYSEWAKNWCH